MSSNSKQVFRHSLDKRHDNPNRVFSIKFPSHERAQQARKWLEETETRFYEEEARSVPLWEIIAAIAEHMQYGKVSPFDTEKRMMHIVLKRLESMEGVLKDIAERDPVVYQQASQAHTERTGEDIEDDFIGAMFDDFDNLGGR